MKWEGFIKFINAYAHRQRKNQEEFKKANLKIPSHSVLVGRSSLYFFQKMLLPPFLFLPPLLEILSPVTHFTDPSSKMQKSFFPSSKTFKILL